MIRCRFGLKDYGLQRKRFTPWKSICKDLDSNLRRDGDKIRFREDFWLESNSLSKRYPSLYRLCLERIQLVGCTLLNDGISRLEGT